MDKEMWEALGKEIAFVAVGMRQRQVQVLISAGEVTKEDYEHFFKFLSDGLLNKLESDYFTKGSNEEYSGQAEGSSQAVSPK